MQPLRIALTKGRLEKSTVQLFEQAGMDCSQLREKGRKLILPVGDGSLQAVLAKAADVITYVEHGVCDMGVVGKDTIMENGSHFFEILDLGFGRCGFALQRGAGAPAGPFRRHCGHCGNRRYLAGKRPGGGGAHPPGVGPAHCKRRQPEAAQAGD